MCRICVEYQLGKLTQEEALRNAREIVGAESSTIEEEDHAIEIIDNMMEEKDPTEVPEDDATAKN